MTTPTNDKSKDDCLDKEFFNDSGSSFDDYFEKTLPENISQDAEVFKHTIKSAMEEYASIKSREEAIGFAKFAMDNTFQDMNVLDLDGQPDKWEYDNELGYTESITNEQLYELYLQSKNKTP